MTSHWPPEQAAILTDLLLGRTTQYGVIFFDGDLRITGWNEGAHFVTETNAGTCARTARASGRAGSAWPPRTPAAARPVS
jgi:hypothetical protein